MWSFCNDLFFCEYFLGWFGCNFVWFDNLCDFFYVMNCIIFFVTNWMYFYDELCVVFFFCYDLCVMNCLCRSHSAETFDSKTKTDGPFRTIKHQVIRSCYFSHYNLIEICDLTMQWKWIDASLNQTTLIKNGSQCNAIQITCNNGSNL